MAKKNTLQFKRYASLCFLTLQSSCLVLLLRYSRMERQQGVPLYIASTAVVFAETLKTMVCLACIYRDCRKWTTFTKVLSSEVFDNWVEVKRMMIPSGLYAVQNNLLFIALSNLEAVTFQISYQLKILSTALFSVSLLGTRLSRNRWFSLVLLMIGVILVQLPTTSSAPSAESSGLERPFIGLVAVSLACLSSGFAGCYFEKMIRSGTTSMWIRNLQLGIPALLFSLIAMVLSDGKAIMRGGLFQGYDTLTWMVILNQALSGLLVSMVVKHAGNILKSFANSLSIIISSLISFYLFGFQPSPLFTIGSFLVIGATLLYSRA
ncbi:nucleotide-sugar transporter [Basidiobolus meristosporus CBS 931.73]|uniref:Nucleotide-sugar transporter n=1 Tax=Basidiobolus meristosporus CBS 931.73 TaxID=1314790 RepID=A0A1Y1YTZ3_9FUNG|nr:nucleotide-sugar transporter [Basidiobolus meristosporus CBS 931.73]|eukprot:ORY01481.1 nucleotide-sugar transporter [Basidiobolus meristosporus CBS 931.73]